MTNTIANYIITPDDRLINNPYLEEIMGSLQELKGQGGDMSLELMKLRQDLIPRFAFSIPLYPALAIIKEYSPIVELGAGSGYWTWCLRQLGVDIDAFDRYPPGGTDPWLWYEGNRWFEDTWSHVSEGDERVLAAYPHHALLMIWPDIHGPMALNALNIFREAGGRILIYIGDPKSSGGTDFHEQLKLHTRTREFLMQTWPGIDERLIVYILK